MAYVIRDSRDPCDPAFLGWLASPVWIGYTWTPNCRNATRFASIAEVCKVAAALKRRGVPVQVLEQMAQPAPIPC